VITAGRPAAASTGRLVAGGPREYACSVNRFRATRFFVNAILCAIVGLVVLGVGVRQVLTGAEWVDIVWFLLVGAVFLGFAALRYRAAVRAWRRADMDALTERLADDDAVEAPAPRVAAPQVAGLKCALCRQRIVTAPEGQCCTDCGRALHNDCVREHQTQRHPAAARRSAAAR
jgi:hypothetical protein